MKRFKEEIEIARELGYGKEVISMIRNAKTDSEVQKILCNARHSLIK